MAQATLRANPKVLDAIFPALLFGLLMVVAVRGFPASVTLAWDPVTNAAL